MSPIMLVALVIVFAVIFSMRRARRGQRRTGPAVTRQEKENGTGA